MTDYCGSTGTEWVPEIFPQACQLHDICYQQQIHSQYKCDITFLNNMVEERGLILLPVAIIYTLAVILFGRLSYAKDKQRVK